MVVVVVCVSVMVYVMVVCMCVVRVLALYCGVFSAVRDIIVAACGLSL